MASFKQIASNPELLNWYHRETKVDHQYKTVVIEQAFDWKYVYIPGLEHSKGEHPDHIDYNRIPQSLHYDDGMKITWGWMVFQAGYQQSVPVTMGQRYAVVAKFTGDIRDTQDNNAIQWQFFIDGLQSCHSDWSAYSHPNQFNTPTEHQFVFQSNTDGWIDLTFWTKAAWADSSGELRIQSLEMFEVPADYGMALPVTPFPNDGQHPGDEPPDDEPPPDETLPTAPRWLLMLMLFVCACVLGVVIYSLVVVPRLNASAMEGSVMEDVLNQLFAIPVIAPIAFSGAIILYLVELGKRLKTKYLPNAALWLTPEFMVVFWVAFFVGSFAIAEQYAYDNVFKQVAELVTQLVGVLGPYVLTMIGTQVTVAYAHKGIRKVDVPGFDQ